MDDLRPPAAPGKKAKKEGFFTKLFKKNVDDVRITKDSLSDSKLDDIRKRIGINAKEHEASTNEQPQASTTQEDNRVKEEKYSTELPDIESDPASELPVSQFQSSSPFESEESFELPDLDSEKELDTLEQEHAEVFKEMNEKPSEAVAAAPEGLPESAPPAWNPSAEDARHREEEKKASNWVEEKNSSSTEDSSTEASDWTNVSEPEELSADTQWSETSTNNLPNTQEESQEAEETQQATESVNDWTQAPEDSAQEATSSDWMSEETQKETPVPKANSWDSSESEALKDDTDNQSHDDQSEFEDHFGAIKKEISQPEQESKEEQKPVAQEPKQITMEHHKLIDTALKEIEDKHKALDSQLEEITKSIRSDIPDWKFQRREVHPNKYFKLKNGQDVKSFKDLLEALSFIDEETFSHHVSENRNDFAEWVKSVLQEEKLAERIRNKKAREELLTILRDHEKKVLEELEENAKALGKEDSKQSKKIKKIEELEEKISKLQEQLEKKSEQLKEFRGKQGKEIKEHIDSHLEEQLKTEKTSIEEQKQELEEKKQSLETKENKVWEQEQSLEKKENELASLRAEQEKENEALDKKREQAESVLHDAAEVKAMKEEAEKTKAQTQQLIADNKQLQKEAAARDKDATKKLEKADEELKLAKERMAEAQELKDDLKERENQVAELEKQIKQRDEASKSEAEKREAQVKALEEKFAVQKQEFETWHQDELDRIEAHHKELNDMLAELDTKTQGFKELADEHNAHLERNEKVLEETEKLRNEIRDRQEAMDSQSMQEYLRTKSENAHRKDAAPSVDEIGNLHLYKLIDECKKAIEENKLKEARSAYNKLREEFGHSKLESHEKSVLYNSIRELYDDIHLAMLNQ